MNFSANYTPFIPQNTLKLKDFVCMQLNNHFINLGLFIIISYIAVSWLKYWFFVYGYKKFCIIYFYDIEHRRYWDNFITEKYIKFCIGYIAVVVLISMNLF